MFKDRVEAGRLLAEQLLKYKNRKDVVVLATISISCSMDG